MWLVLRGARPCSGVAAVLFLDPEENMAKRCKIVRNMHERPGMLLWSIAKYSYWCIFVTENTWLNVFPGPVKVDGTQENRCSTLGFGVWVDHLFLYLRWLLKLWLCAHPKVTFDDCLWFSCYLLIRCHDFWFFWCVWWCLFVDVWIWSGQPWMACLCLVWVWEFCHKWDIIGICIMDYKIESTNQSKDSILFGVVFGSST